MQAGFARACMWGAERATAPANRWDRAATDLATAQAKLAEAIAALAAMEKLEPFCTTCGQALLSLSRGWSHFAAAAEPRREIEAVSAADAGHEPAMDWRPVREAAGA
jgi:hypothetical protein